MNACTSSSSSAQSNGAVLVLERTVERGHRRVDQLGHDEPPDAPLRSAQVTARLTSAPLPSPARTRYCPRRAEGSTEHLVRVVIHALRRFVTDGEWEDVTSSLPNDLVSVLS
jgi:hypothetical protein